MISLKKQNQEMIESNVRSYQQQMKFIFFTLAFDEKELYQMFRDFYLSFMPKYEIGRTEFTTLIEMMASPEYLGKKVLEESVFPIIGVTKNVMDIGMLNKDTFIKDFKISSETHQDLWENLNEGAKTIKF